MEKDEKFQKKKIGDPGCINKNCWLAKTLNYSPAKRCQYCELKFRNCLFFQYLIISSILILFLFALSFLIEGKISTLVIISIFSFIIVYGYFFNKSTEKIVRANYSQRKANEALEKLTGKLEEKVDKQTKEIREKDRLYAQKLKLTEKAAGQMEELISKIVAACLTFISGEKIIFVVADPKTKKFECVYPRDKKFSLDPEHALHTYLNTKPKLLVTQKISLLLKEEGQIEKKRLQEILKYLKKQKFEVVMPIGDKENILGIFLIGPKINKEPYSQKDIEALQDFSITSTPVLMNMILYSKGIEGAKI